jgi:hypothetical protein
VAELHQPFSFGSREEVRVAVSYFVTDVKCGGGTAMISLSILDASDRLLTEIGIVKNEI